MNYGGKIKRENGELSDICVLCAGSLKTFFKNLFLKQETITFVQRFWMDYKFRVSFLEEAKNFLDSLSEKPREKIVYNIWKARQVNDKELFKKLQGEIWEFRTLYEKKYYRLFAF